MPARLHEEPIPLPCISAMLWLAQVQPLKLANLPEPCLGVDAA
jgi:hypothetical protein